MERSAQSGPAAGGFTLIEVLVVVAIVAVLATAVVISMPASDARRAAREADRFHALLALVCEQAELAGRSIGIHALADGYGFSIEIEEGWLPFPDSHRFRPRRLEGLALAVPGGALPALPPAEPVPMALCGADGALTPFELRFVHQGRVLQRVRAGADGRAVREEAAADGRGWHGAG
ncbi:MAG: prepilin-type N-terminal cleavage/methylation domain-containing protein [Xanthomonadales bacterium]|nr:prepilin-type N-terminal cleavage/methylation domain-containing protein [Xanthomonadales bacterium]